MKIIDLEEQRVCVKFCFKIGKTIRHIENISARIRGRQYEPNAVLLMIQSFKMGRALTHDDSRPGRLLVNKRLQHRRSSCYITRENRCLTVQEIAEEVNISTG